MKLQADAKHDQDHADFRELFGDGRVRFDTWRMRSDRNPGDQVADDGREAEALGEISEDQRRAKARGKRENELDAVHEPSIVP